MSSNTRKAGTDDTEMAIVSVKVVGGAADGSSSDTRGPHDASSAEPPPPPRVPPSLYEQGKEILFGSKLNVFYVCIPIAFLSNAAGGPGALTFTASFFALIPLAAVLGDLTEDLADQTNDAIGALINVTFGNITEVIVGFTALRLRQFDLIQMTMVGSVLGNMLLVLGSSLVVGGTRVSIMSFNGDAAKCYVGLLFLGVLGTLIPTAFGTLSTESGTKAAVVMLSGHVGLVMILFYALYLFFQLRTHKTMFDGDAAAGAGSGGAANGGEDEDDDDDDGEGGPKFSFAFAFFAIGVVAVLISLISDFLVATVSEAASTFHLSRHFIGLIVIPIVGNVAEHASAIIMAAKGKTDIAFGVALGSSIQIQMFAFPLIVVASWMLGMDLDLNITPFLSASLFAGVVITYACVFDSSATWLQGAKMLCAYVLMALAFLDAPDPPSTVVGAA